MEQALGIRAKLTRACLADTFLSILLLNLGKALEKGDQASIGALVYSIEQTLAKDRIPIGGFGEVGLQVLHLILELMPQLSCDAKYSPLTAPMMLLQDRLIADQSSAPTAELQKS